MPTLPGPTVISGGGGFAIGSSYLWASYDLAGNADNTFPNLPWTLGGIFNPAGSPSAGSDISINGGDNTLVDINTTGWYQATIYANCDIETAGVGVTDGFEIGISFINFTPAFPGWATIYAGLPRGKDLTSVVVTTAMQPVTAGSQFKAFAGAYMSVPTDTWHTNGGLQIVRVA